MTRLNLAAVFRQDAEDLRQAREKSKRVHPSDIRAAGNEVEEAVRNYLRRMLAPRYHVTNGHLIDSNHEVSPQLDIIIADNFSGLSSLLTTADGTEYVPVESALAIGEVKSTYYKSHGYYEKFASDLKNLAGMHRPLIRNTYFGGGRPNDDALLSDIVFPSQNKYLNSLFSFMLCVDGGDFDFTDVKELLTSVDPSHLPALVVLLDKGVVTYGKMEDRGLASTSYPSDVQDGYDWCFFQSRFGEGGSLEGAHLARLYGAVIAHLSNCRLDPPRASQYLEAVTTPYVLASSLEWANS